MAQRSVKTPRIVFTAGPWADGAQFFARLASIPLLDDLPEWKQLDVADELERVLHWQDDGGKRNPDDPARKAALEEIRRSILPGVHKTVREVLHSVLQGNVVQLPTRQLPQPCCQLDGGVLKEFLAITEGLSQSLIFNLLLLMRQQPFPFGLCPVCGNIFVRVRRQKYCSPNCTYKGTETTRKEEKRGYMRKYMADRRAKEREKKEREKRKPRLRWS